MPWLEEKKIWSCEKNEVLIVMKRGSKLERRKKDAQERKKKSHLLTSSFPGIGKYLFFRRFKTSLELIPDFPSRLPAFRDRPPTPPSRAQEALFSAKAEVTTSAQVRTQENPFLRTILQKKNPEIDLEKILLFAWDSLICVQMNKCKCEFT